MVTDPHCCRVIDLDMALGSIMAPVYLGLSQVCFALPVPRGRLYPDMLYSPQTYGTKWGLSQACCAHLERMVKIL